MDGGVDSIHLDVMDGHFVDNLTLGPVVVEAVRRARHAPVPQPPDDQPAASPTRERFAEAGSDLIVFHVEADDDPAAVIEAIERLGSAAGIALNPETPAEAVLPYLDRVDLLLVMTVHPGWGGQAFLAEVLPEARARCATRSTRRGLDAADRRRRRREPRHDRRRARGGGRRARRGSGLYSSDGDLAPTVAALRAAARARSRSVDRTPRGLSRAAARSALGAARRSPSRSCWPRAAEASRSSRARADPEQPRDVTVTVVDSRATRRRCEARRVAPATPPPSPARTGPRPQRRSEAPR